MWRAKNKALNEINVPKCERAQGQVEYELEPVASQYSIILPTRNPKPIDT